MLLRKRSLFQSGTFSLSFFLSFSFSRSRSFSFSFSLSLPFLSFLSSSSCKTLLNASARYPFF